MKNINYTRLSERTIKWLFILYSVIITIQYLLDAISDNFNKAGIIANISTFGYSDWFINFQAGFASDEDYIGHAIKNDPVSMHAAKKIPFVIYTSGLCKEKHPQLQRRIENSLDNHIVTDKLMYTIMDIAGVLTVNGVSYRKESLLD